MRRLRSGGLDGHVELNTMMPLMAYTLLDSIEWMANAVGAFAERCVAGIEGDEERCRTAVDLTLAPATALVPLIGLDTATKMSNEVYRTGRTVREVALDWGVLPREELDAILDPEKMTEPGV